RMEGCGKMKIVGVKGKPFAGAHKHTAFGASIAREIRVKIEPDHGMVAKTAAHENNFIPASTTHDKSGETVHVAQSTAHEVRAMDYHCRHSRSSGFRQGL